METYRICFKDFLPTAFDRGSYATDDVIAFILPLFQKVQRFHESGLVGPFERTDSLFLTDHTLDVDEDMAHEPSYAPVRVRALFPRTPAGLTGGQPAPDWSPDYLCFESALGHHDPQTDIFCLGLILGSITLGLDLYKKEDLELFIRVRSNPSGHHERIHPTISRLITEMTEPDRSQRTQDLYDTIRRLQFYRDYDPEKQADLSQVAGWVYKKQHERDAFILDKLRNRLFDTSRRNRLLYYKPNMRFVDLTVSSVPVVLHYQSIRPELLFTWNSELSEKIRGMKEIILNKYLRFEDHDYLPSSLDRVRVESRRALQEYGFSQLKLVIAFLSWHNLKEDPKERIQSPLLLISVELKKNKKVKEDHYVIRAPDNAAAVNPVLAAQLKDLYGIRLPEFIDLEETDPESFCKMVKKQIEEANQGIVLNYIDKPRLRRIQGEARQTVNDYRKRQRRQADRAPGHYTVPFRFDPAAVLWEFAAGDTRKLSARIPPEPPLPEKDIYELADSENNPYSWDFDVCHMVLGNFNYKKMSLVRDYNLVIDQQMQHAVFDDLFSDQPRSYNDHLFDLNRPEDWFHVLTADPTQTKAILQSRAGYSYIIQGPPGTGKSQTITNLIADFVARGKTILFVCEKRAALDVVYHRMKQNGLEELCCYIHDSQGDKREFIKDLKGTYEDFIAHKMDLAAIRSKRLGLLQKMNGQLELIEEFHVTSVSGEKETGIGVRKLVERIIGLRQELVPLSQMEEELLPPYRDWLESGAVITGLGEALETAGFDPIFSAHPFNKVRESIFLSDSPHNLLHRSIEQAQELLEEVDAVLRENHISPEQAGSVEALKTLVQLAVLLQPLALSGNLRLANPEEEDAKELERQIRQYRQQQEYYRQALQKNIHWKQKLSEQDLANSLALAAKSEGSFTGFLNGPWKRLKKQLQEAYDFSGHALPPSVQSILGLLDAEYGAARRVAGTKRQLQEQYRLENIDTAWLGIDLLQHRKGDKELDYILRHPHAGSLINSLQVLHQPLSRLEAQLNLCLQDPGGSDLSALRDDLQNIQLNADALGELLPALRAFTRLRTGVKAVLRHFPLRPAQLEAVTARSALHQLYQSNRAFAAIDRQALERAVNQLGEGYSGLQQANADYIRASVRQRFLQQVDLSGKAGSQLNEEEKKFKKIYNEGRKILENEFGKSMRYKSIRELSARESGQVLRDIKPVWLMSPYSVSDSLPLDNDHFDVVIFDEASQITLEEGVPALYRARQAIIVGDEKQMPPTDFFGARARDPEDLEGGDDPGEDDWLADDADSLLAQGARKLGSTLLSWHYRSHYETLISYSNHAFYEGALLTIPDKTIHHTEKAAIGITRPEDARRQADSLFDRSISFHWHTRGLYEKRSNKPEADYIAHLVRELFARDTRESIGIVAFSQEQQHRIEEALDELAGQDAGFGQKLEDAYTRTENDQFTGLIIKNLENIQGDERDIIIMSVCYGLDARKKMLMNFGPVNKRGGEKRLNVLFSRARKHMAVVSSIRHEQITNEYNEGASYLRRFLHYAEMVSMGQMDTARAILDSLVAHTAGAVYHPAPSVIRQQLKEQIEHLGYEVAEQVGQSDFKCSLAVKAKPEDDSYVLGILIDDDKHYRNNNLVEQYYQRPDILRRFGWKVIPVFARDWLHQPQKVLEQILKMIREAESSSGRPGSGDPDGTGDRDGTLPISARKDPADAAPDTGPAGIYGQLDFLRLHYRDGKTGKFWETATEGNKLVVRWGNTGAKGQIQVKTFPDGIAAGKEMERLILEKRGQGYLD